jgi:hypothetical protein
MSPDSSIRRADDSVSTARVTSSSHQEVSAEPVAWGSIVIGLLAFIPCVSFFLNPDSAASNIELPSLGYGVVGAVLIIGGGIYLLRQRRKQ